MMKQYRVFASRYQSVDAFFKPEFNPLNLVLHSDIFSCMANSLNEALEEFPNSKELIAFTAHCRNPQFFYCLDEQNHIVDINTILAHEDSSL